MSSYISDIVQALAPALAQGDFKWWLLGVYCAVGPVPDEVQLPPSPATPEGVTITRWRWGGLVRIALLGAQGHSKLADRVGTLESGVEQLSRDMTATFNAVVSELRAIRSVLEALGVPLSRRADAQTLAPPADEAVPPGRRNVAQSRP